MSDPVHPPRRVAYSLVRRFLHRLPSLTPRDALWFLQDITFGLDGVRHNLFLHPYNCGWPPGRMTERGVELALADAWLADPAHDRVIEIGAVTPYYWPRRVARIVDPGDNHPLVTDGRSIMDLDLTGQHVLSISTFEHIGSGEYGLPPAPEEGAAAFAKLFREAAAFLVTVPMGYNPNLDRFVMGEGAIPGDVAMQFLSRSPRGGNRWEEVARPSPEAMPYGRPGRRDSRASWANTLVVFRRRVPAATG